MTVATIEPETERGPRYEVRATIRACKLLTALAALGQSPLRDLAEAAALSKPTAYRLLSTLVQAGFAEECGSPGVNRRWQLGPGIETLALGYIAVTASGAEEVVA